LVHYGALARSKEGSGGGAGGAVRFEVISALSERAHIAPQCSAALCAGWFKHKAAELLQPRELCMFTAVTLLS